MDLLLSDRRVTTLRRAHPCEYDLLQCSLHGASPAGNSKGILVGYHCGIPGFWLDEMCGVQSSPDCLEQGKILLAAFGGMFSSKDQQWVWAGV